MCPTSGAFGRDTMTRTLTNARGFVVWSRTRPVESATSRCWVISGSRLLTMRSAHAWHHRGMSAISDRYDARALGYEQHWAPVLEETARRLLDEADGFVTRLRAAGRRPSILDIGTGTGVLAIDALRRWPESDLVAVDASRGMLERARARAREAGVGGNESSGADRWVVAEAGQLPLPDASVDLAVSSFVFQLVPDRPAALREVLRVLRPGGRLGFVTWLIDDGAPFPPADEFDEAVLDAGIEDPESEEEARAGDFPSARAAADGLRRAGFRDVSARPATLTYAWTRESYLAYKLGYDEAGLLESLDEETRRTFLDAIDRRFDRLGSHDYRWRSGVVFASGHRPDREPGRRFSRRVFGSSR